MDLKQLATSEASALVDRLTAAMAAEIEAATARAQASAEAALDKLRTETEQLKAALAKAKADEKSFTATLDKLRADDKVHQATLEKFRAAEKSNQAAFEKLKAEEATLRSALAKAKADEKVLQSAAEKARVDQKAIQAALEKARADEKVLKATVEQARAEVNTLQATVEQLRAEEQARRHDEEGLRADEQSLRAALAREGERAAAAEAQLQEALAAAANARAEQAAAAPHASREDLLALAATPLDHLRNGFHQLNAAQSVADVLTAFIEALGAEFSRVALFDVSGNRLEGRQQTGFAFASDISKVAVPLTKGSPLAEAVRSGKVQGLTASELNDSSRKLFGGSPTFVLVLPIEVGGQVEAVVYADNSDHPQPDLASPKRSVHVAEILLWHTIPLLTRLNAAERTTRELQDYGRQLLTDLENVYASDVTAGFKGDKLQRRLAHNVDYARSMFAQRAQSAGIDGTALFDEELSAFAGEKKSGAFGRDLASCAAAERKAEAS
jgi:chemotaxis protein histidine kinase CheA